MNFSLIKTYYIYTMLLIEPKRTDKSSSSLTGNKCISDERSTYFEYLMMSDNFQKHQIKYFF